MELKSQVLHVCGVAHFYGKFSHHQKNPHIPHQSTIKQDKRIKCITTVWGFFPIFFSTLTYNFLLMTLAFILMTQFLPFGFQVGVELLWFLRVPKAPERPSSFQADD